MKAFHNKRKKKYFFTVCLVLLFILLVPVYAFADTANTKSILSEFPLESNSVEKNVMRSIGWEIVLGLHWLVSGLETGIYSINDAIGGFFASDAVLQLEQKVFPLALALITLVILFIGLASMFKPLNFAAITGNFVIGIVVFMALPYLLSNAYSFTTKAITYLNTDKSGSQSSLQTMSDRILVDNITDTTRYDAENFKSTDLKYKNYFTMSGADTSKISNIDVDELVNPDDMQYSDVWKNKLTTNGNGSTDLSELSSGQFGFVSIPIFSSYYYRWNVDWFTIFSTLIVTASALLLSGIKIARLIYELAINQTMAQIMALLDVYTAQRLKKCIQLLISTLGTLFAIFFMLQMYILGTSYVSAQTGINTIVRFIVMLALAFAVVDGPNLFEQIFGIDVGMKSGLRTLYGLKAAGSLVTGGVALMGGKAAVEALRAKGLTGTARSVLGKAGSIAGGIGGATAGVGKGVYGNRQRVNSVRQGFSAAAGAAAGESVGTAAAAGAEVNGSSNSEQKGTSASQNNSKPDSGTKNAASSVPNSQSTSTAQHQQQSGHENGRAAASPEPIEQEPPIQSSSTEPDNSSNKSTSNRPQNTEKGSAAKDAVPGTIGEYVHTKASAKLRQSKPYNTTRHTYSLTRGSIDKHGDNLVAREELAQDKLQKAKLNGENLSHHQAIRQAKKDLKHNNGEVKK